MGFRITFPNRQGAFTTAELVIAVAISTLILLALSSLYLFCTRTFMSLANTMDMDNANRLAVDTISQELRQADRVVDYATNRLGFELNGQLVVYGHLPESQQVVRRSGGTTEVVLNDCDHLGFEIFQRTPQTGSYEFFPTATVTNAKVVRMTWINSRNIGSMARQQTTMRSSQVVLRNQKM